MGSSIISRLSKYVNMSGRKLLSKTWIVGQPGLRLSGLKNLTVMLCKTHRPKKVIIHAGANDIGYQSAKTWIDTLESILTSLIETFPNTTFIWSDMLPRLKYRNHGTKQAEKKRRRWNVAARQLFYRKGFNWVVHPVLQVEKNLISWDGVHLSTDGQKTLLRDFEEHIQNKA